MQRTSGFATMLLAAVLGLAATAPARTETMLRIDETAPGEIDPAKAAKAIDSVLLYNIYDTLLLPGPGGVGIAPHLAESYTGDGTTFTFKLRPGVKFHSGNEVTADDVVFSLNRLLAIGSGFSPLFRGWVKQAEALDPATVRITLTGNYAPFLAATFRLGIVDKKTVMANLKDGPFGEFKDYGQAWLNTHDAGSGAYRVVAQTPMTETTLEKFPGYFLGVPEKAPDKVHASYGLEAPTELALMRRGELDVMMQWASPETKRSAMQIKGVSVVGESGIAQLFINLNTKKPPLDDVHCRRAIGAALDYDALIGQANITPEIHGAKPSKGPLVEGMLGYDPSVPDYTRDMAKAKAELAQCKYQPAEHEIEIIWVAEVPLEERFALLMQQNWGELGFRTKITRMPNVSFFQAATKVETTPNVMQLFYNARTPDPDAYLFNAYHSSSVGQYAAAQWLQDPEVDALINQGRSTVDPAAREQIYRKIVLKIRDLQPTIFGYQIINTYAKSDRVDIPALEDPAKNTHMMGMNLMFRRVEMK